MKTKQKVYLAGGMRLGWRKKIKRLGMLFFDPAQKESKKSMTLEEYVTWDLHYIKQCNIIFCYMEKTNPSGIGLAAEMGYAKGLGKTVILVIEPNDTQEDRYLAFLRKVSDIVFEDFEEGLKYLKLFE